MRFLGTLIASLATAEAGLALQRMKRAAAFYVIAALGLACGIGFFVGAAYIAAARRYGDVEAAIGFGFGFIAVAILVLLIHRFTSSRSARRVADRRSADTKTLAGAAAIAFLPILMRSRAGLIAPLVAIAAYAIYNENRKPPRDPH